MANRAEDATTPVDDMHDEEDHDMPPLDYDPADADDIDNAAAAESMAPQRVGNRLVQPASKAAARPQGAFWEGPVRVSSACK